MAPTAPIHGPLSDRVALVAVRTTVVAVQDALAGLHRLDGLTAAAPDRTVGACWMKLLNELFVPIDGPVPPLPPDAAEIATAVAGATEQERFTVLQILAEVSIFLSVSAVQLGYRIETLPVELQPEGWQDTLGAVCVTARSLMISACPRGSSPQALTDTLVGLLRPRP